MWPKPDIDDLFVPQTSAAVEAASVSQVCDMFLHKHVYFESIL